MAALVSNEIQLHFDSLRGAKALIDAGKVKLLAVGSVKRSVLAPGVTTLSESGLAGFSLSGIWFGVVGPAGLPQSHVARLNEHVNAVLKRADAQKFLGETTMYEISPGTPEQFRSLIAADVSRYAEAARVTGIKPE